MTASLHAIHAPLPAAPDDRRDHNGQALAYVYYEEEPGRRSAARLLSYDKARRLAVNIAQLPERLRHGSNNAESDAR
jgi:hypothetical protein